MKIKMTPAIVIAKAVYTSVRYCSGGTSRNLETKFRKVSKMDSRQANAIENPTAAIMANLNCFLNSFLKERDVFVKCFICA